MSVDQSVEASRFQQVNSSRTQTPKSKVFGIGLSKTGTTSLARALEILGYRTKDNLGVMNYDPGDVSCIDFSVLDANDAFTDTPIPSFYKELDKKYPGSKFILTVRDAEGWLMSCKKQFTQKLADKQNDAHNRLFMDLYKCSVFDEQKFRNGYVDFVNDALQYLKQRPQDLLVFDITAGDGWEKLCPFLGEPKPDMPFPRANVTQIRWMNPNEIVAIAIEAGQEALRIYRFMQGESFNLNISKDGLFPTLGVILRKARYRLRRDSGGALKTASNVAQHIIFKNLKRLNPQIPIVSPETSKSVPYSVRCKWNHLWLVNSLADDNGLRGSDAAFALSLALIEDRVPILGVVYAPAINTTYYAMAGKGAFKLIGSKEPKVLERRKAGNNSVFITPNKAYNSPGIQDENESATLNRAFSICLAAEGERDISSFLSDTVEWETAAANVVANALGIKIINDRTREELIYNKKDFTNGCISLQ